VVGVTQSVSLHDAERTVRDYLDIDTDAGGALKRAAAVMR
jgi:hypothetical protein